MWWLFNEDKELLAVCNTREEYLQLEKASTDFAIHTGPGDLDGMMKLQDIFQQRMDLDYDSEYIIRNAQWVDAELHEMLREIPFYKQWKNYDWSPEERQLHKEAAKEELIDAWHFMMNIANALGMSAYEFCDRYYSKYKTNHLRQDEGY